MQQEVTRALTNSSDFVDVPLDDRRKCNGVARDSDADPSPAFVIRDGHYQSARWPGDVRRFSCEFSAMFVRSLENRTTPARSSRGTCRSQGLSPSSDSGAFESSGVVDAGLVCVHLG